MREMDRFYAFVDYGCIQDVGGYFVDGLGELFVDNLWLEDRECIHLIDRLILLL